MNKWMRLLAVMQFGQLGALGALGAIGTLGALGTVGCDAIEVSTVRQEANQCPPGGCFNSSDTEIPGVGMHEFNLYGLPNPQGTAIVTQDGRAQIIKNGTSWDLFVEKGRIRGRDPLGAVLQGTDLEGAEIIFEHEALPPLVVHIYRARISHFALGSPDEFEAYQLGWHHLGKPAAPTFGDADKVCADPIQISDGEHREYQYLGLEVGESVVFEGDRVDSTQKTIDEQWQPDWFTVGCAGTALGKLFMLRQTTVSSSGKPTLEERRAHLKLLVADYCGDGTSFTMPGEELFWRSTLMDYPGAGSEELYPYELEARWTSQGAACLAVPRLADSGLPHGYSDVAEAIYQQCPGLPACENTDAWDLDGATLVTANPEPAMP
jgi:hypothetical protein